MTVNMKKHIYLSFVCAQPYEAKEVELFMKYKDEDSSAQNCHRATMSVGFRGYYYQILSSYIKCATSRPVLAI